MTKTNNEMLLIIIIVVIIRPSVAANISETICQGVKMEYPLVARAEYQSLPGRNLC